MKRFLQRFTEPSTWAGISALSGLFGVNIPTPKVQAVSVAVSTVAGLLAIFVPEVAVVKVAADALQASTRKDN